MAGFGDSGLRPDMDENKIGLSISPAKPADVASPYVISSSVPEAVKNDGKEFKKADQSHGEVLETSWKLISCGNRSREYANIEQEVSRYQTCNSVTALQGDKHDAGYTRNNSMISMVLSIMPGLPCQHIQDSFRCILFAKRLLNLNPVYNLFTRREERCEEGGMAMD